MENQIQDTTTNKPKWIRVKTSYRKNYRELRTLVDKYKLNTICQSGSCPNMGECWEKEPHFYDFGKYLHQKLWILWVKQGKPLDVNWDEP